MPGKSIETMVEMESAMPAEALCLRRVDDLVESGAMEEALGELRLYLRSHPESTRGSIRFASLLRQNRQSSEARRVLKKAVIRAPRCHASRMALTELCLETGSWDEAIRHGRVMLQLRPRSLPARLLLSDAYLRRGLVEKALRITDEIVRLDPSDPSHHFRRGFLLQQTGCMGAAVRAFVRVMELLPDEALGKETRMFIEALDTYQIRQILLLLSEDIPFRVRLRSDPADALSERGFELSEIGMTALMHSDLDSVALAPIGWRHYRYH